MVYMDNTFALALVTNISTAGQDKVIMMMIITATNSNDTFFHRSLCNICCLTASINKFTDIVSFS